MEKMNSNPGRVSIFPCFDHIKSPTPSKDDFWQFIAQTVRGIPIILAGSGKISGPSWQLFLGCDYRICSMDTAPWSLAGLQMEPFGSYYRATQGTQIDVVFQTGSPL